MNWLFGGNTPAIERSPSLPLDPAPRGAKRTNDDNQGAFDKEKLLDHLRNNASPEFARSLKVHMETKHWPNMTFDGNGRWIGYPRPTDDEAVIAMISGMLISAREPKRIDIPNFQIKEVRKMAEEIIMRWLVKFEVPSLKSVVLPWPPGFRVSSFDGKIFTLNSLLLDGLSTIAAEQGGKLAAAAGIPAPVTRLDSNPVFQSLENPANREIILSGVPGTGKTRANYEVLSHQFGLYFIANTARDIGSANLSLVLHDVCVARGAGQQGTPYWMLLFMSHLLIYEALELYGTKLSPYRWLLLQLYPRRFTGGIDIFAELYCHLRQRFQERMISDEDLAVAFQDLLDSHKQLLCVVDEAQDMLVTPALGTPQFNVSLHRQGPASLLTLFGNFVNPHDQIRFVVSGTSPELHHVANLARLHKVDEVKEVKYFADKPGMVDVVNKYFHPDLTKWIITDKTWPVLQGRARTLMNFLYLLMLRLRPNPAAWATEKELGKVVKVVLEDLVKDWETRLELILRRWDGDAETSKTMIYEAVANYSYVGLPLILYDDTARLMDYGIVRLQDLKYTRKGSADAFRAGYAGAVQEPIIIEALMRISLRRFNPFKIMLAEDGRSKGYTFESACVAMLMGLVHKKPAGALLGTLPGVFHLETDTLPKFTRDFKNDWKKVNELDAWKARATALAIVLKTTPPEFSVAHDAYAAMIIAAEELILAREQVRDDVPARQAALAKAVAQWPLERDSLNAATIVELNNHNALWLEHHRKKDASSDSSVFPSFWNEVRRNRTPHLPVYYHHPFRILIPDEIGNPLVTSSDQVRIDAFFKNKPTTFYTPGTNYGPDFAFIMEFCPPAPPGGVEPPSYYVPAFIQAKFEAASGDDAGEIEKAIAKSDPMVVLRDTPKMPSDTEKSILALEKYLKDPAKKFDYTKTGSVRFVFRASKTEQGTVPRAFIDAKPRDPANPETLVIYLEKDLLFQAFADADFENALHHKVKWVRN